MGLNLPSWHGSTYLNGDLPDEAVARFPAHGRELDRTG
jgi:hypothetical protein